MGEGSYVLPWWKKNVMAKLGGGLTTMTFTNRAWKAREGLCKVASEFRPPTPELLSCDSACFVFDNDDNDSDKVG
jgi:hypothetical protein